MNGSEITLYTKKTWWARGVYDPPRGIYDGSGWAITPLPYKWEGYEKTNLQQFSKELLDAGRTQLVADSCPHYWWEQHAWVLPSGQTLFPLIEALKSLDKACEPGCQAGVRGLSPEQKKASRETLWKLNDLSLDLRKLWLAAHGVSRVTREKATEYIRKGLTPYYV